MSSAQIAIIVAGALIAALQAFVAQYLKRKRTEAQANAIPSEYQTPVRCSINELDYIALEAEAELDEESKKPKVLFSLKRQIEASGPYVQTDPSVALLAAMDDLKSVMIAESRRGAIWGFIQNFAFFILGLASSYYLQ